MKNLSKDVLNYLSNQKEEIISLIKELCEIPSFSGKEKNKALYIKKWLNKNNVYNVYIDEVYNVICEINYKKDNDVILFCAHIDTVFDEQIIEFSKDDKYLYGLGVGDDTTCVAMLMMVLRYIINNNLLSDKSIVIAFNSNEEGLGNLKGIKHIISHYKDQVKEMYSFDNQYDSLINECVGSHRYEIIINTKGGHSYRDFLTPNAIHIMSKLINNLYKIKIPQIKNTTTTYNVGVIEGGTSINTIAQDVKMLYEYRSNSYKCLNIMKNSFYKEIEKICLLDDVYVKVNVLGRRPCSENVDKEKLKEMSEKVAFISQKHSSIPCVYKPGSTDCNIPMSMGIASVCVGCYLGSGEHTRQEKVLIDSIDVGLKITFELILSYFNI